jgi:hypothetical protein
MNNANFLKVLEERPLRMAVEPELPRPQIAVHRAAAPAQTSDTPLPAIVILGLAFCVVYAFMHGMPV